MLNMGLQYRDFLQQNDQQTIYSLEDELSSQEDEPDIISDLVK